ncbi:hypothetical protein MTO96_019376 [Rhipicephalus appendiculatus]
MNQIPQLSLLWDCNLQLPWSKVPQSMTHADVSVESQSAGAAHHLQFTASSVIELHSTTAAVIEEPQPKASPDFAAEAQFMTTAPEADESDSTAVTPAGLQSTTTSIKQKLQSMSYADVSVESHFMRPAAVVQESQSTNAAKLPAPECITFAGSGVESQFVTAAGTAQESQPTTGATVVLESQSMALANVAVKTKCTMADGAAQDTQSTASTVTELPCTTAAVIEEPQPKALPDHAAKAHFITTAPEPHESGSIALTAMELQPATTTSMAQEPQSTTLADVAVESQFVTATGAAQELQFHN